MKSFIQKTDWKIILIIAVVIMIAVNFMSEMMAHYVFQSTAAQIKDSFDETTKFIATSKAKAKKRDEDITALFEENFERVDGLVTQTQDRMDQFKEKLETFYH